MLTRVEIAGYKSIRDAMGERGVDLGRLNVLIGANGAGKSNLISFLDVFRHMIRGSFQSMVQREGGANVLLHNGSSVTQSISCLLRFDTEHGPTWYNGQWEYASPDRLLFTREMAVARAGAQTVETTATTESALSAAEWLVEDAPSVEGAHDRSGAKALRDMRAYHFCDTTDTSPIRQHWLLDDNADLRNDGGNLASFLHALRETRREHYNKILQTVQLAAPFISELVLEPTRDEPPRIMLKWRDRSSDDTLLGCQMSDGTLRMLALATLLLQPVEDRPAIIIIDEPELGLHPDAITILTGMLRAASTHSQVIISTQSVTMVNQFGPEDVIVVERKDGASVFRRLESAGLEEWLQDYGTGDLWEKNVIEGGPGLEQ